MTILSFLITCVFSVLRVDAYPNHQSIGTAGTTNPLEKMVIEPFVTEIQV